MGEQVGTACLSCIGRMSETRSCSRWAYEAEVERELAEMTGSLEQLAELEEKEEEEESGSSLHGSETYLREY